MKQEIYDKLKDKEKILKNAVDMNFIRLSPSEFHFYAELYYEHFGKKMTVSQMNCNTCRLKALKELANAYFNYKQSDEAKRKKSDEAKRKNSDEAKRKNSDETKCRNSDKTTTKKKRGRPRKIDIED